MQAACLNSLRAKSGPSTFTLRVINALAVPSWLSKIFSITPTEHVKVTTASCFLFAFSAFSTLPSDIFIQYGSASVNTNWMTLFQFLTLFELLLIRLIMFFMVSSA